MVIFSVKPLLQTVCANHRAGKAMFFKCRKIIRPEQIDCFETHFLTNRTHLFERELSVAPLADGLVDSAVFNDPFDVVSTARANVPAIVPAAISELLRINPRRESLLWFITLSPFLYQTFNCFLSSLTSSTTFAVASSTLILLLSDSDRSFTSTLPSARDL